MNDDNMTPEEYIVASGQCTASGGLPKPKNLQDILHKLWSMDGYAAKCAAFSAHISLMEQAKNKEKKS